MTVIKRKVTRNFTVIANDCFNDQRLSGEELGALAYLLSRPNNWSVRLPAFKKRMKCGRDKSYGVLNSISEKGYVHRHQERDAKTGSYRTVEYIVYDLPTNTSLPEKPEAAKIISADSNQILSPPPHRGGPTS